MNILQSFYLFVISGFLSVCFGFMLAKTDLIANKEGHFFRRSNRILSSFLLFSMFIMEMAWIMILGFAVFNALKPLITRIL